jgi:hypothetical protein
VSDVLMCRDHLRRTTRAGSGVGKLLQSVEFTATGQRFPVAFRFSSLRASVGTSPLESCQAVESGPITYSDSLLSSVRVKSRRPAEHEREPSERIRRETQETIAIWSHSPELLVARDRWDRNTGRRQDEFFCEPHVDLYDLPVWSDVEERLPVRSPEWGGAACRGHAYRATRTPQGTHVDLRSAGFVRDVDDVLPGPRDVEERDFSRRLRTATALYDPEERAR